MLDTRQSLRYATFAAAAGTIGLAAGLLFAPASGAETRRRLARKGRDLVDRTAERVSDVIEVGREKVDELLHH